MKLYLIVMLGLVTSLGIQFEARALATAPPVTSAPEEEDPPADETPDPMCPGSPGARACEESGNAEPFIRAAQLSGQLNGQCPGWREHLPRRCNPDWDRRLCSICYSIYEFYRVAEIECFREICKLYKCMRDNGCDDPRLKGAIEAFCN